MISHRGNSDSQAPHGPPAHLSAQEFATHYRSAFRILWLIAVGIIGDSAEAEDVVQEGAIVALRKLDQFQAGTSFQAWTGRIVRNLALNVLRSGRRRRGMVAPLSESGAQSLQAGGTNDPALGAPPYEDVLDSRIMDALADMPDIARACLLLRTVGDLQYADISHLLDIPEGTAMSHVHRARLQLRKRLAPVWAEQAHKGVGEE